MRRALILMSKWRARGRAEAVHSPLLLYADTCQEGQCLRQVEPPRPSVIHAAGGC